MTAQVRKVLAVLVTVALSGSSPASGSAPSLARVKPSESPKAFLLRVYKPYAVQDAPGIFQMTPQVLSKFFEPKLVPWWSCPGTSWDRRRESWRTRPVS